MAFSEPKTYTPFGKAVAKRLIDLDMNNTDLSKALGVKPAYINDILKGTRKAIPRKKRIAEIVGIKFEDYADCC